jgi:hypothetical protein
VGLALDFPHATRPAGTRHPPRSGRAHNCSLLSRLLSAWYTRSYPIRPTDEMQLPREPAKSSSGIVMQKSKSLIISNLWRSHRKANQKRKTPDPSACCQALTAHAISFDEPIVTILPRSRLIPPQNKTPRRTYRSASPASIRKTTSGARPINSPMV